MRIPSNPFDVQRWIGTTRRAIGAETEAKVESGPARVGARAWAEGEIDPLPLGARAAAEIGARLSAGITIVDAVLDAPDELAGAPSLRVGNEVGVDVGAHAGGALSAGVANQASEVGARFEAFIGARAIETFGLGIFAGEQEVAAVDGSIEAWAGAGVLSELRFQLDERNRVHLEGGLGMALGIGGAIRGEAVIDPNIGANRES